MPLFIGKANVHSSVGQKYYERLANTYIPLPQMGAQLTSFTQDFLRGATNSNFIYLIPYTNTKHDDTAMKLSWLLPWTEVVAVKKLH